MIRIQPKHFPRGYTRENVACDALHRGKLQVLNSTRRNSNFESTLNILAESSSVVLNTKPNCVAKTIQKSAWGAIQARFSSRQGTWHVSLGAIVPNKVSRHARNALLTMPPANRANAFGLGASHQVGQFVNDRKFLYGKGPEMSLIQVHKQRWPSIPVE